MAMKEIWGIKKREAFEKDGVARAEKNFWTRIGIAHENKDGSWNLRFDYLPAVGNVTIQVRDPKPMEEKKENQDGEF